MACVKCNVIADQIQCQGCADYIIKYCEEDDCQADYIISNGSISGHPVTMNDEKIS